MQISSNVRQTNADYSISGGSELAATAIWAEYVQARALLQVDRSNLAAEVARPLARCGCEARGLRMKTWRRRRASSAGPQGSAPALRLAGADHEEVSRRGGALSEMRARAHPHETSISALPEGWKPNLRWSSPASQCSASPATVQEERTDGASN